MDQNSTKRVTPPQFIPDYPRCTDVHQISYAGVASIAADGNKKNVLDIGVKKLAKLIVRRSVFTVRRHVQRLSRKLWLNCPRLMPQTPPF